MVNLIEKEFERNPYNRNGKLTSTIGYMYGQCARKLWYSVNENKVGFSPQEIKTMQFGLAKHKEIEESKFPEYLHEYHIEREIPEILGVTKIGATLDCISIMPDFQQYNLHYAKIIEIKPRYTRYAYFQTLIERFVCPTIPIFIYDYTKDRLFPLKADYKMSIIYLGRMITALRIKPPRVPYSQYNKAPCNTCLFRERCYSEPEPHNTKEKGENKKYWDKWKTLTNPQVSKLLSEFL